MAETVRGTLPPKPGPKNKVLQLKAGERVNGVILSPAVWGVTTHWNDRAGKHGRSERCTKDRGECSGCNGQLSERWKGYIYVYDFIRKCAVFLELTPGAYEVLSLNAPKDRDFRGLKVECARGVGGDRTRLSIQLSEWVGDMEKLPEDQDPEPVLESLWKWRR